MQFKLFRVCVISIILLFPFKADLVNAAHVVSQCTFRATKFVSISAGASAAIIAAFEVHGEIKCTTLCGMDTRCMAFYTKEILTDANGTRYECKLLSTPLHTTDLLMGNGSYWEMSALVEENRVRTSVPQLSPGVSVSLMRSEVGLVAFYQCSLVDSSMSSIVLRFRQQTRQWPQLNELCRLSLCHQTALTNTLLLHTNENGTHFEIGVSCQQGEIHVGQAECNKMSGVWTVTPKEMGVPCLSTSCFRLGVTGKARYSGVQAVSESGVTCQRWDSHNPQSHGFVAGSFPLDGYDLTTVSNHCRDPDGTDAPWCYLATGGRRWEFCGIPVCDLAFTHTMIATD